MSRGWLVMLFAWAAVACAPMQPAPSTGHLRAGKVESPEAIPQPVSQAPVLPPPRPSAPSETYTVVVSEVPVKELLFALARDAELNVDIHPQIGGAVTLNAVDQTLDQILERLSGQVELRYERRGGTLVILPDTPYLRTYHVDYVNLSRETNTALDISNALATGGGELGTGRGSAGGSDIKILNTTDNRFWETLGESINAMLERQDGGGAAGGQGAAGSADVIVNAEVGVVTVRATARQHAIVADYLEQVMASARRQVIIEASIVEVRLNRNYQQGIDWQTLQDTGFNFVQISPDFLTTNLSTEPFIQGTYEDGDFSATVSLLDEFGDTRVLSSPKLMALNNQTAVLKVVDNEVYFTVETDTQVNVNAPSLTTFDTTPQTVPVGVVMSVTPQIDEHDVVTLNVRPTISRVIDTVLDPNPALAREDVTSEIPVIRVRELESVMTVNSGQIAVLGGLMQDANQAADSGIPFLTDIPVVGEAFTYRSREFTKTELVVFLRPTVVHQASLDGDLSDFRPFLERSERSGGGTHRELLGP